MTTTERANQSRQLAERREKTRNVSARPAASVKTHQIRYWCASIERWIPGATGSRDHVAKIYNAITKPFLQLSGEVELTDTIVQMIEIETGRVCYSVNYYEKKSNV